MKQALDLATALIALALLAPIAAAMVEACDG